MIDKNLLFIRRTLDMTQPKIAEMFGVNRTTYANYERGGNEPALSFIQAVLNTTGVSFEELTKKNLEELYPPDKLKSMVMGRLVDIMTSNAATTTFS